MCVANDAKERCLCSARLWLPCASGRHKTRRLAADCHAQRGGAVMLVPRSQQGLLNVIGQVDRSAFQEEVPRADVHPSNVVLIMSTHSVVVCCAVGAFELAAATSRRVACRRIPVGTPQCSGLSGRLRYLGTTDAKINSLSVPCLGGCIEAVRHPHRRDATIRSLPDIEIFVAQ